MNVETYKQALNELSNDDYQAILEDDAALVVFQDKALTLGKPDEAYVIYELGDDQFDSVDALKAHLLEQAEEMLQEYYQYNPLSKMFFNQSLMDLINENDENAFVSMPGQEAKLKLFCENGKLVAEGPESPRFKYGFNLHLKEKMLPQAISNKVKNWVQSGTAYEEYISVNVCRFSCIE
ncbi:hypothetical protein QCB44_05950 [Thiomicrorhabdus sp. zzn3]|uniref:hypothetical protein n=1 Tax=Thiomicrorhabdus sp. zzn3 TaxID=3039775 RepID=UPI002437309F|nr:hypothetical protein [Thiomicrorhabdus sp. zzn3]MDG6778243.1 hypothetical protein [Thiomicrorhabdus sp. zzn3]